MPLLDHCWCCSLRVAASVISVYVTVAYIIAFLMELWWVWDTGGQLPYLAYILISGYLVTSVLSAILVKGISDLWIFGIVAILIPEGGMVLFMSFHFWKIYTIYGLTEVTCWACRLIVNLAGLICVYFLYLNWKEEKQVMQSLRDLNMASRVHAMENGRRVSNASVTQLPVYTNVGFRHDDNNMRPPSNLKRNGSNISLGSRPTYPKPTSNEFNASTYNFNLNSSLKSRSMFDLSNLNTGTVVLPPPPLFSSHAVFPMRRYASMGFFPSGGDDRMRNGYFTAQPSGFVIDQNGKVAFIQDPIITSRISVESDDLQKYRDVAL